MAKFTVTVTNVANFELEADSEETAWEFADQMLGVKPDQNVMAEIADTSTGWEVTDVHES